MAEDKVDGLGLGVTKPWPVLIRLVLPLPRGNMPALHIREIMHWSSDLVKYRVNVCGEGIRVGSIIVLHSGEVDKESPRAGIESNN